MFCTNCGKKLDDTVQFCPYCGKEIGVSDSNKEDNSIKKVSETPLGTSQIINDTEVNTDEQINKTQQDSATEISKANEASPKDSKSNNGKPNIKNTMIGLIAVIAVVILLFIGCNAIFGGDSKLKETKEDAAIATALLYMTEYLSQNRINIGVPLETFRSDARIEEKDKYGRYLITTTFSNEADISVIIYLNDDLSKEELKMSAAELNRRGDLAPCTNPASYYEKDKKAVIKQLKSNAAWNKRP